MSGLIGVVAVGFCWLVITVGMLLFYLLVIGPGLERLRDAVFMALRSDADYDEMHASDIALGVTGISGSCARWRGRAASPHAAADLLSMCFVSNTLSLRRAAHKIGHSRDNAGRRSPDPAIGSPVRSRAPCSR